MIKRTKPRTVPNKAHYLTVSLTSLGDTSWRLPSPAFALLIVQMMQDEGLVDRAASIAEGDEEAILGMGSSMLNLYSIQGALIGLCWFNKDHDLETDKSTYPKTTEGMVSYGTDVFEELYEAEWPSADIVEIWGTLLPRLIDTLVDQNKGVAQANFTPAQPEPSVS